MAQTCLIFNPVARGGKAEYLRRHLGAFSAHCDLTPTTCSGDARRLAAQAVRAGVHTVIAAGGDGTVNEVLNGIGDVPGAFERTRLGLLPLGTMNVFARELVIPAQLNAAWDVLQKGREMSIDLPLAEFVSEGKTVRRYFMQLAGAGWDARAVELVSWQLKKKIGPLAYVAAAIKALREARPKITVAGTTAPPAEQILLGNGRYYGGKLVLFPKANMHDSQLDLCVFPKVNLLELLRITAGLAFLRPLCFSSARHLQATSVTLTSNGRVPLELDGESVGELPVKITLLPKSLRVIVP